ncbi:MAG: ATP phosphoribosyltransferase [Nitrospirae bacterium RIFCSPLOWO2_12_FULL_63_8]|nr:MAG: ATP phosphoribosyltransferase [Nitrospirae bacterium RIFCSPLOWO2_12_FULL_63_8]
MITVALSKGKLLEPAIELFRKAGYVGKDLSPGSRRLIIECPEKDLVFMIIRPSDVPTYVEYGAADVGVVGKDMLLEQNLDVYEPMDLKFGRCRLAVAARKGHEVRERMSAKLRVATKYPNVAERYYNQKGIPVEIIKLYGSIELAPVVGLADRIVDLVSTGRTLKAHDLEEIDVIAESTARLIVNRASLKLKHGEISELMARLRRRPVARLNGRRAGRRTTTRRVQRTKKRSAR